MATAKSWCKSKCQDSSTGSRFARKIGQNFFAPTFIILLPKFQTSTVNRRRKKKFKARTARALAAWSYYRFLQRLLQKSGEYPWCRVITVNEAYTSKTCGMCGQINYKLGERKIFCCLHCKMRCDRDVDGARNILLRFLSE